MNSGSEANKNGERIERNRLLKLRNKVKKLSQKQHLLPQIGLKVFSHDSREEYDLSNFDILFTQLSI